MCGDIKMIREHSLTDPDVIARLVRRHNTIQFNPGERVDFKQDWPKTSKVIGWIEGDEVLLTVLVDSDQLLLGSPDGWQSCVNITCAEFIPSPSYNQNSCSTAWTINQYLIGKAKIHLANQTGWIREPQIEVNQKTEFELYPLMFQFLNILESYYRRVARMGK
jgi:hypothetical protein